MEEYSDILSQLIKRKKPSVPAGYFENLPKDFMQNLISGKLESHNKISEEDSSSLPDDFFKNFGQNLKDELEADLVFERYGIRKSVRPVVPENYFSELHIQTPPANSISRSRIVKITFWSSVASVAATITVLIGMNLNWQTAEPEPVITQETSSAANQDDDAILETYGDYLDEESIVDYIVENDLELSTGDDETYFNYLEDDIEDIYLELD